MVGAAIMEIAVVIAVRRIMLGALMILVMVEARFSLPVELLLCKALYRSFRIALGA